jgi:hypothetical protein
MIIFLFTVLPISRARTQFQRPYNKNGYAIGPRVRAARATTGDVRTSGHLDLQASSHNSGAFATLAKRRETPAVLRICFAGK